MGPDIQLGSTDHSNPNPNNTGLTNQASPEDVNEVISGDAPDRQQFHAPEIVRDIWTSLGLPESTLSSLTLPGSDDNDRPAIPSSFKIGRLAQSVIALSALAAAQVHALRNRIPVPRVEVPLKHAVVEFQSEKLYRINGKPAAPAWGTIGGLHKTSDGHVRIHDSFPNHRDGTLKLLGLPSTVSRADVAAKVAEWTSLDLETVGVLERGLAIYALRSYAQWDALPQSKAIADTPITLRRIRDDCPPGLPARLATAANNDRCLRGLRVVEMSRVIAAPLAGRTLAAHGADVLWITSPALPDLPSIDLDLGRGKRTAHLDIDQQPADLARLKALLRTADVFIQGFRPGSLAGRGLSPEELAAANPGLICANLSAFGPAGPWSGRRGFDSLVQTCSGMNVSEAEHFGGGGEEEAARPMPCQALDHGAGYLLAAGISAALCRRAAEGGSWQVDVSLAGVMKYLRSLGQYPGRTGFDCTGYEAADEVAEYLEARDSGFGRLEAVRHSARVEGCEPGWDVMPKPLGSDTAEWLS